MEILYNAGFRISIDQQNKFLELVKKLIKKYHREHKEFLFLKFKSMKSLLCKLLQLNSIKTYELCLKIDDSSDDLKTYIDFYIFPFDEKNINDLSLDDIKKLLSFSYINAKMMLTWLIKSNHLSSYDYVKDFLEIGMDPNVYDKVTGKNLLILTLSTVLDNPVKYKTFLIIKKLNLLLLHKDINVDHEDKAGKKFVDYLQEVMQSKNTLINNDRNFINYCLSIKNDLLK